MYPKLGLRLEDFETDARINLETTQSGRGRRRSAPPSLAYMASMVTEPLRKVHLPNQRWPRPRSGAHRPRSASRSRAGRANDEDDLEIRLRCHIRDHAIGGASRAACSFATPPVGHDLRGSVVALASRKSDCNLWGMASELLWRDDHQLGLAKLRSAGSLRNWVESGHLDEPTRRSVGARVEPSANPRKRTSPGPWCRSVRTTRSSRRPLQRS
jgi:hypothetical protein